MPNVEAQAQQKEESYAVQSNPLYYIECRFGKLCSPQKVHSALNSVQKRALLQHSQFWNVKDCTAWTIQTNHRVRAGIGMRPCGRTKIIS